MHAYMYIKFIIHKILQNLIKLESCTLPPFSYIVSLNNSNLQNSNHKY